MRVQPQTGQKRGGLGGGAGKAPNNRTNNKAKGPIKKLRINQKGTLRFLLEAAMAAAMPNKRSRIKTPDIITSTEKDYSDTGVARGGARLSCPSIRSVINNWTYLSGDHIIYA
jgi:hypothetical protein